MAMARDRLEAAGASLEAGFPSAAVSLAYSAMLYAARAALSEEDRIRPSRRINVSHQAAAGSAAALSEPSYLTLVENERLTSDPWKLDVIEPLNCLPCAVAGICQVQDDLPLLALERLFARRDLPESFPRQVTWPLTPSPVSAFVTSIHAVNGLPAVALDSFGLLALSVGGDGGGAGGGGGAVGVAAPPNALAMARWPASLGWR